jgi:hypothetical protein
MVFPSGCKKNTGKMGKSSVPVLSAAKPWFSHGFSHIGPIALALLPIHARPCLQVLRCLVRRLGFWWLVLRVGPKSSFFRGTGCFAVEG